MKQHDKAVLLCVYGCNFDIVFVRTIFMLQNFPKTTGSSGRAFVVEHCQETAKLFFFILISLLLIFLRISSIISLDIQAFGWNSKGFPGDLKNLVFP